MTFFFSCYGDHRDLHSFPTRRSSDLGNACPHQEADGRAVPRWHRDTGVEHGLQVQHEGKESRIRVQKCDALPRERSEEHTSELQSRRDLVCRLLLEKKKKKY